VKHLRQLAPEAAHPIELVEADLLNAGGWPAAVAGCDYVMHVASPFPLEDPKDPEAELYRPAVEGTLNVLRAVSEATTVPRRVVLTSSVAATSYGHDPRGKVFDGASRRASPANAFLHARRLSVCVRPLGNRRPPQTTAGATPITPRTRCRRTCAPSCWRSAPPGSLWRSCRRARSERAQPALVDAGSRRSGQTSCLQSSCGPSCGPDVAPAPPFHHIALAPCFFCSGRLVLNVCVIVAVLLNPSTRPQV
jgi:hypothetical protein